MAAATERMPSNKFTRRPNDTKKRREKCRKEEEEEEKEEVVENPLSNASPQE